MTAAVTAPARRVAFISQCLGRIVPPKAEGSIATWTYETARHLCRDHPVLLIECGERPFRSSRVQHEGIACFYVPTAINRVVNALHSRWSRLWNRVRHAEPSRLRPAYTSIFHNLGFSIQAAWAARRWRADVIHVHNFSQFVPVMRLFNPSARIVIHMNCEWLSQHEPRMIARRLESVDAIVGCAAHIIRKIVARFPNVAPKCHVVFNGANVERFVPCAQSVAAEPPSPLRILFVGRVSPEKGVHLLVEAFKTVAAKYPTAQLDLVGGVGSLSADFLVALSDDPHVRSLETFYRSDYFAHLQGLLPDDLKARVHFHGDVTHGELATHYARATVFVSASLSDAFPLTVVEAMAAGLPIAGSAVGGVPEAVVDELTGLLAEPNSADALASALCRLLADGSLRQRMALEARQRALRLFSWRAIADTVAEVYRGAPRTEARQMLIVETTAG
jgi:spore coat protein SA